MHSCPWNADKKGTPLFSVASGGEDLLEKTITTKRMEKDEKYHPSKHL